MKLSEVKDYTLGVLRGAFKNKNILDDISAEGKNLRYKGNNLGDSYMFTGTENYIEDEQVIGKWINGKPLYRRIFHGTTPSNNTNATTNIQISPVLENLVSFDYTMKDSSNYQFTGAANVGNGEIYSAWITDTHYIRHRASSAAFYNRPVTWIAEYTKTTDAPGADVDTGAQPMNFIDGGVHSENEVIIGQWIDGKPLYRKSYQYDQTFSPGEIKLNIDLADLEKVTKVYGTYQRVKGTYEIFPTISTNTSWQVSIFEITKNNFGFGIGTSFTGQNAIKDLNVTFEYTKTTDEAQDMSITSTLTTTATDEEVAEVFA